MEKPSQQPDPSTPDSTPVDREPDIEFEDVQLERPETLCVRMLGLADEIHSNVQELTSAVVGEGGPQRLSVNDERSEVTYGRTTYHMDLEYLLVVQDLIEAKGEWVSSTMLKNHHEILQSMRIDRVVAKFKKTFPVIGDLIEPSKKGYRIDPSQYL